MKSKKGDFLVMDNIIIAVLDLLALIVLIFIFRSFIFENSDRIKKIGSEAEEQARGEKCRTFFGNRMCIEQGKCPSSDANLQKYEYQIVNGECDDKSKVSCEKREKEGNR